MAGRAPHQGVLIRVLDVSRACLTLNIQRARNDKPSRSGAQPPGSAKYTRWQCCDKVAKARPTPSAGSCPAIFGVCIAAGLPLAGRSPLQGEYLADPTRKSETSEQSRARSHVT